MGGEAGGGAVGRRAGEVMEGPGASNHKPDTRDSQSSRSSTWCGLVQVVGEWESGRVGEWESGRVRE